jgi:hypothetical protein
LVSILSSKCGFPVANELLDRFRTLVNVSGDLLASKVMTKLTGITDEDSADFAPNEQVQRVMSDAGMVQQQNQNMPHNQTKEMV